MKMVLFDLDETLIDGRVIDSLAVNYGFPQFLRKLREDLQKGVLSHPEVTKTLVRFLEGKKADEFSEILGKIPLMQNVETTLQSLKEKGFKVGVVSDGFTIATDFFSEQLGLDYAVAHEPLLRNGRLTGNLILAEGSKNYENWKGEVVKKMKKRSNPWIVAVGNGDLDAPMLEEADVGIAFNASQQAKDSADIEVNGKDLSLVLQAIEGLLQRNRKG